MKRRLIMTSKNKRRIKMDRSSVVAGVKEILVPFLGVDKSKLDAASEETDLIKELGIKSTDTINIVLDAEKKWNVAFEDEEVDALEKVTIKAVVDLVMSKLS
jgi:acyl carrier protein